MTNPKKYDVLVIGGGLAGLCSALQLSKAGIEVILIEKHSYPRHKVCGEYVSNEVIPYLNTLNINPFIAGAKDISKFIISDRVGKTLEASLPLGGFGISRYAFDQLIYERLKETADVIIDTVDKVDFDGSIFTVITQQKKIYESKFVVGAFGKRSNLDSYMKREFIQQRSPWLAVKGHFEYDLPDDTVMLHNYAGGYCGLSKVETNAVNACYLGTLKSFKPFGNITDYQNGALSVNPHLKDFFSEAKPIFKKPLSISQISFMEKQAVEGHIFMTGDSAGLIHPLCGNGMAMAIHSAKLLADLLIEAFSKGSIDRPTLEAKYTKIWRRKFSQRMSNGSRIQRFLLHPTATNLGFRIVERIPSLLPRIIKATHGDPIV